MNDDDAERPQSGLRGRLSDVFLPSLIDGSRDGLVTRLGDKAIFYAPTVGFAEGTEVRKLSSALAAWLGERDARYEHARTIIGVDRDVAEGTLTLRGPSGTVELPVAVVSERKRAREVELRVYHACVPVGARPAARRPRATPERDQAVSNDVAEHLAALRLGDADAAIASFETDGFLRDGAGKAYDRASGALREFYVHLLQSERGSNEWVPIARASADDGRTCAVEYETESSSGDRGPREGLMVVERGDSGLVRAVRLYDDV